MDATRKTAGGYTIHLLIEAAAEYEKRTGARPTHIEATEDEIAAMADYTATIYRPGSTTVTIYDIKVVPIKRRIGRAAEPVIEWEDA